MKKKADNSFLIFMYHRVIPRNEVKKGVQAGMYVEPETFEGHLHFLQKYFTIVPISELSFDSKENLNDMNKKKVCAITFDDGWYDFYTYVFPILKKLEIPATLFLPTNFIGTERWFWTDRLTRLLIGIYSMRNRVPKTRSSSNRLVKKLGELRGSHESRLEKAISLLKPYRVDEIEDVLSELSKRWDLDSTPTGRAFLSWKEVREMAESGLISYGSHTASHRILTTLTDEEIQNELIESKERLINEKAVDPSFIPFCYPNGNYNEKIASMVREAGYKLAVTTNSGWNHLGSNPFTFRRIAIHQDMTSTEAMFGCRVVGVL